MRILYLSQYFPPEPGATQIRAYEMARNLVRLGHQVTMLCEIPNHPSGIIPPEYRGRLFEQTTLDGIEVIRVWVKASPVKNFRNRMLFYLTFMVNAALAGLLLARGRYDLIYASSPPLFVGGTALALRFLKRIPMVFEVRDLWPESAVALGEISNPVAISWAARFEEACYARSQAIVVVTQGIMDNLVARGVARHKLTVIPNGANVDLFRFSPASRQRLRAELGLEDKFVAIYAGNHGIAYGLETLVEAARQLGDSPEIHILLVGDGPNKQVLADLVAHHNLENITLHPAQPMEHIPGYLSAADVALIPLRDLAFFRGTLPVKMFDAWACERPVLLSAEGEARTILDQADGGLYVPPEDPGALVQALFQLKNESGKREKMGKSGRAYTVRHYSRQAQAEGLAHFLEQVLKASR